MPLLSLTPVKGPRFAGSLRSTPALQGFGDGAHPGRTGERYMDADELTAMLDKKPSGGHWNSRIAVFRNNGLIETDGRRLSDCRALAT